MEDRNKYKWSSGCQINLGIYKHDFGWQNPFSIRPGFRQERTSKHRKNQPPRRK